MLERLRDMYHGLMPDSVRHTYRYRELRQMFWNRRLRKHFGVDSTKLATEARYWEDRFKEEGGTLLNSWYQQRLLDIAQETDASYVKDSIVADFGCGPRGSLCWASEARQRIGIDVLSDVYARFGIREHNMVYVKSSETCIPLPNDYVDIMFTLNAMDHVNDFPTMSKEVLRVMTPGGEFVGSFNLNEPPSFSEPQTLSPEMIEEHLLCHLDIVSMNKAPVAPGKDPYLWVSKKEKGQPYDRNNKGFLWVRAKKP